MKLGGFGTIAALLVIILSLLSCTQQPQEEMTILIRMMPAQERFFDEVIISKFEEENNCKINLATFKSQWDIERLLRLDGEKKEPEIALVKTPFEMTRVLAYKDLIKPLAEAVDSVVVEQDMAEYHALASGLGNIDGRWYYVPRKLETRILFYRKSMVADAVANYPAHRNRINTELKEQNGYGLPAGYVFEPDPADWDFYDLYVVGSIWATEEYNNVKMGRLAHRGAKYGGTALFLADRALQLGATKEDILQLNSEEMAATYAWERIFIRNGLYNADMWNVPWTGSDIYDGIKDGKVFLAYFQQIDNFLIHGWPEDPAMPTYLPEPDDMGLAVVPKGVSFELDKDGNYVYEGSRSISTGGWWWGIPKSCVHDSLAYKLARFITSKEMQAEEVARFGMLPVRKDIINNFPQVFSEGWVGDIFKVSVEQLTLNQLTTVPLVEQYSLVGKNLVEAWYELCVNWDENEDGALDVNATKARLTSGFLAEQKEILGDDYPLPKE